MSAFTNKLICSAKLQRLKGERKAEQPGEEEENIQSLSFTLQNERCFRALVVFS